MKHSFFLQTLKPIDQITTNDTPVTVPITDAKVPDPLPAGTKVKSNDGGYIWIT